MGAVMLLSGAVAIIVTLPSFYRIVAHHLTATMRILSVFILLSWGSLIWAGKEFSAPLFW
jgi:hypothetical protein